MAGFFEQVAKRGVAEGAFVEMRLLARHRVLDQRRIENVAPLLQQALYGRDQEVEHLALAQRHVRRGQCGLGLVQPVDVVVEDELVAVADQQVAATSSSSTTTSTG